MSPEPAASPLCRVCAGLGGWSRTTGMPSRWIPTRIVCLVCRGTGRWREPPAPPLARDRTSA